MVAKPWCFWWLLLLSSLGVIVVVINAPAAWQNYGELGNYANLNAIESIS